MDFSCGFQLRCSFWMRSRSLLVLAVSFFTSLRMISFIVIIRCLFYVTKLDLMLSNLNMMLSNLNLIPSNLLKIYEYIDQKKHSKNHGGDTICRHKGPINPAEIVRTKESVLIDK